MKIHGFNRSRLEVKEYASNNWCHIISLDDVIAIIRDDNLVKVYEFTKSGIFRNVIIYEDNIKASELTGHFMFSSDGSCFV